MCFNCDGAIFVQQRWEDIIFAAFRACDFLESYAYREKTNHSVDSIWWYTFDTALNVNIHKPAQVFYFL